MAEVVAQRRLKYFYDLPNTKVSLNSTEFAEEVSKKLSLSLEPFKKALEDATEKEADDIFALLDFMLNADKSGLNWVSSFPYFGQQALQAKSGKELAEFARTTYIREFSIIFEKMVGSKKRANSLFKEVLDEVGFKSLFAELAEKRSKELAEKIAKIESGQLQMNSRGLEQVILQANPSNIIQHILGQKEVQELMLDAASGFTMSSAKKGPISKLIDEITYDFFPSIVTLKQVGRVSAVTLQKNILGRRYLTDGLPVNYGGKLVGKTLSKILGLVPSLGRRLKTNSVTKAFESLVGVTIATAITANRFLDLIYPKVEDLPGGGGKDGKGVAPTQGQQKEGDAAREGVKNAGELIKRDGTTYYVAPAKVDLSKLKPTEKKPVTKIAAKRQQGREIKKAARREIKKIKESKLPPQVKNPVIASLQKVKKNPTAEGVNAAIDEAAKKLEANLKKIKDKIANNPNAPQGTPGVKGVPGAKGKGTAEPATAGVGGGKGSGKGAGFGPGVLDGSAVRDFLKSQFST